MTELRSPGQHAAPLCPRARLRGGNEQPLHTNNNVTTMRRAAAVGGAAAACALVTLLAIAVSSRSPEQPDVCLVYACGVSA